jgi:hypothetical protein
MQSHDPLVTLVKEPILTVAQSEKDGVHSLLN